MRTNLFSFVLASENRKKVVQGLLAYPQRHWSCSSLEEITKLPHATVFRTIKGLEHYGILRSSKVNRRDMVYEFIRQSPLIRELEKLMSAEKHAARTIAAKFARDITTKSIKAGIKAIVLYGSTVRGTMKPGSDIDMLVVVNKRKKKQEQQIHDLAAQLSLKYNIILSAVIMDEQEIHQEKKKSFLQSVKESMEVLYGKTPL